MGLTGNVYEDAERLQAYAMDCLAREAIERGTNIIYGGGTHPKNKVSFVGYKKLQKAK